VGDRINADTLSLWCQKKLEYQKYKIRASEDWATNIALLNVSKKTSHPFSSSIPHPAQFDPMLYYNTYITYTSKADAHSFRLLLFYFLYFLTIGLPRSPRSSNLSTHILCHAHTHSLTPSQTTSATRPHPHMHTQPTFAICPLPTRPLHDHVSINHRARSGRIKVRIQ